MQRLRLAIWVTAAASAGFVGFADGGEIRRTPLVLRDGGTPDRPAVFDGQGLVIDLGTDVTDLPWQPQGDVWSLPGRLLDREPTSDTQRAGLFVDEVPLRIVRDRQAEQAAGAAAVIFAQPAALLPGQMGYTPAGAVYFRWPAGKTPGRSRLIAPSAGLSSGVSIACSHLIVRNVTARYAANDGFNIHGKWVGIRLENVKAFSNGDEGISAHGEVQLDVDGAEVAWNGSTAGGIADVNDSITTYRRCVVHHNLGAAFFLEGRRHEVHDTLIHHQTRDFDIRDHAEVVRSGIRWER